MQRIPSSIQVNCTKQKSGISLTCLEKSYSLNYPKKVWQQYPLKNNGVWVDILTHLLTINIPVVSRKVKTIKYNTSKPFFESKFREMVRKGIPHSTEDYELTTQEALNRLSEASYLFENNGTKLLDQTIEAHHKSVISLSGGKDSLLTLGVSNEIGLNPIGIYINDTVTPTENNAKIGIMKKIEKEFNIKTFIVINQIEKLVDYETWNEPESMVGYTHMMTGFCFISLPFIHKHNAKYLILGNEQDMNFTFTNKDGFLTYPSYDQSSEWTEQQSLMIEKMTAGSTKVTSLIRPLTNLGIIKILHTRYKEFGKYEFSCDCLNDSKQKRWCCNCNKCARHFIFLKAFGIDPRRLKFPYNMLNKKYKKHFVIFNQGPEIDCYEKSKEAFDQQLLAFYLTYKNDARGYLINLFKKMYLKQAIEREDELMKKFLTLYDDPYMPLKLKKEVYSIYKEELKK